MSQEFSEFLHGIHGNHHMIPNKQQLVVIWIAALYFAVLGSSFLFRSYYLRYHQHGYVSDQVEMIERRFKSLSASKDHATPDPAVARFEERYEQALDKMQSDSVKKYEQSLWFKMSATILRAPEVLIIGLPFIICFGAVALYSLNSNRKK